MRFQTYQYIRYLMVLISTLLLFGCQTIASYYGGYKSDNKSNIDLYAATNQQNSWKTFDLSMEFQTVQRDNYLSVSGTVKLGLYYELNASRIKDLSMYLFFVDADSKVVETARITKMVDISPDEVITFDRLLKIPPTAVAISFGYDGEALGGGGDMHDSNGGFSGDHFYELPKRSS